MPNFRKDLSNLQDLKNDLLFYNEIVKNVAEGIYLVSTKDLTIRYANPKFLEMFGYEEDEIVGQHVSIINAPTNNDPIKTALEIAKKLESGSFWQGEVLNIKKNGEIFWCNVVISSFLHKVYGEVYISIQSDITSRKKDEQELKRINQALYESNEEMRDFFHTLSHDFQAPLRKISIFSDRLDEEKKGIGKKGEYFLTRLRSSVDRMNDLMNDLVNYTQISSPESRHGSSINLNEIVQQVIQDLEIEFKEINGKVEIAPLATIEANPFNIRGLFHNLISNSLKYRKPNVPPVIKISGQYSPTKKGYYDIYVQDNGIGFDDKYAVRIFKPFERLHRDDEYEGGGMGLALCKKIVERHGGHIDVKSIVNEGTTFIISLPKNNQLHN